MLDGPTTPYGTIQHENYHAASSCKQAMANSEDLSDGGCTVSRIVFAAVSVEADLWCDDWPFTNTNGLCKHDGSCSELGKKGKIRTKESHLAPAALCRLVLQRFATRLIIWEAAVCAAEVMPAISAYSRSCCQSGMMTPASCHADDPKLHSRILCTNGCKMQCL